MRFEGVLLWDTRWGYLETSFSDFSKRTFKSTFNNYDHVNSRINKMYSNVPTRNEDEWDEEDYTNMMNEIYPDEPTFAKMFPLSRKNIKPEMLRNRPDFSLHCFISFGFKQFTHSPHISHHSVPLHVSHFHCLSYLLWSHSLES